MSLHKQSMTPFTLILPDGEVWESYVMFTQNNCILYANIMFHANIKHINCLSGTNKKYKNLKRSGFLYLMKNPSRFIKRIASKVYESICLAFSSLAVFTEKKVGQSSRSQESSIGALGSRMM